MSDILYARNRYIVPFMFESKGKTFDELVREIEHLENWGIQELSSEKVERDVYELIQDSFVMKEELNNIGCSFFYKTSRY